MVKVEEHIEKIERIKKQIANSKGRQRMQYEKCLHKLLKQAAECYSYLHQDEGIRYIKCIKGKKENG